MRTGKRLAAVILQAPSCPSGLDDAHGSQAAEAGRVGYFGRPCGARVSGMHCKTIAPSGEFRGEQVQARADLKEDTKRLHHARSGDVLERVSGEDYYQEFSLKIWP